MARIQLALDEETNDLIKSATNGVERISDGRFVVQSIRSKLRLFLGDWALDPSLGFLSFDDYNKDYDLFDLEFRARAIILGTTGVLSIEDMTLVVVDRKLVLTFEATTIYGGIDLTIPWGN